MRSRCSVRAGLIISEFYVSPSNDDEWGEDVPGRDVLAHNEKVEISFTRSEEACK